MSEQNEREARYAEAIRRSYTMREKVQDVMAVADEEQAGLRAEVERLRNEQVERWEELKALAEQVADTRRRSESAEARVRELEAAVQELRDAHQAEVEKVGRLNDAIDRARIERAQAEDAETALAEKAARVKALARAWEGESSKTAVGMVKRGCAVELRAVLSEPATAPAKCTCEFGWQIDCPAHGKDAHDHG